jgi:hypothetical protein
MVVEKKGPAKAAAPKASKASKPPKEPDTPKPVQDKAPEAPAPAPEATQPKKKKIVIPFVLPWESRPALQNQSGMGAFGTKKEVFRWKGGKAPPADTALKSENVLTLFTETNKFSSQAGMHAFGAHRDNVTRLENAGKELQEEKVRMCQLVIPKQAGNNDAPTQSGQTPMGAIRRQVMKIEYRPDMRGKMEKKSEGMLTKMGTPNPNCHAGTAVIDKFRRQVPDIVIGARMNRCHDRKTESVLPKFAQLKGLPTPARITGAGSSGLGPFRQVVTPVVGGYTFTAEEIVASKRAMTWATSPLLQSQQGTGGFQSRRDVVSHVKY